MPGIARPSIASSRPRRLARSEALRGSPCGSTAVRTAAGRPEQGQRGRRNDLALPAGRSPKQADIGLAAILFEFHVDRHRLARFQRHGAEVRLMIGRLAPFAVVDRKLDAIIHLRVELVFAADRRVSRPRQRTEKSSRGICGAALCLVQSKSMAASMRSNSGLRSGHASGNRSPTVRRGRCESRANDGLHADIDVQLHATAGGPV